MQDDKLLYSKEDTALAKKRTILAANRTLLSHIRTSLVLLSLAFAYMKIDKQNPIDAFTIVLFVLSAIFLILGIIDYITTKYFINNLEEKIK